MKKILLLQCFFLVAFSALAQNYKAFSPFYKETVKGDMLMVGNSVLNAGVNPNQPYTGSHGHNALIDLNYTNVAPATGVFNSSSANVANPNVNASCLKVKGAYLYWSAAYTRERELNQTSPKFERSKFKNIKFKTPNASSYTDLVGELVYDGYDVLSSRPNQNDSQRAYVYKKDVTSILTAEAATRGGRFDGTYTVANLMAPKGNESTGVGYAAGWTLVIVYEDLSKPSRYITLFDGFSAVNNINSLAIPISGFKTVPTGPVRAKFGFAALEGEIGISGDKLSINTDKGTYGISAPGRNLNNFFNSTITDENGVNTSRNPASTNLFGFDVGLFNLPPSIFNNNATSATLLPYTNQDAYYPFLFAFNVEVVEPHVVMEKRVYKGSQDITGNRGGVTVNLGEQLIYKVKFKNIGNDDAKDLVIVDKLPKGLDFVKTSIQPSNFPSGTHIDYTYGAEGGTLTVTVDNSLVKANSVTHEFSFGVEVVNDCKLWRAPCANQIKNEVVATYNGVENPKTTPIASKSFKSEFTSCFGGDEGTSDFVVNVDFLKCVYKEQVTHCKLTTTLKAEDGFTSYQWTTVSGTETVNATTQNLVVSAPGVYKVTKTKAGCSTMYEEFTVIPNTNEANHPVESMITSKQISGETYVCPSTGKKYPQVYLCGKNTTLNMRISITNATNFLWEKKVNCTNTPPNDCPPDLNSYGCGWTTVGNVNGRVTNQSFTEAGDYRLTVTYDAECVSSYYFRVTKNELDPKVEPLDIVCTTPGKITVKDVPATGYQFALMKGTTTVTNYQTSNIFTVPTAGSYNVLIKQTATNTAVVPCTFEISNIVINQKNPSLTVITTDMACDTNKGNMRIQVNDPPYNPYTIVVRENNQTGAELYRFTSSGTTTYNDITLNNYFNHGTYFVAVENSYGCTITKGGVKINKIPELKATASVFKPITNCAPGVIRITASGGKKVGSYDFEYNGTHNTSATDYFDLEVTTAGVYNFVVTDANGCTARASITITKLTPPVVTANYEIKQCGQQILINFTEPQSTYSYTYQYALEGKAPQTARTIAGLTANTTYTPTVLYTINGQTCTLTLRSVTIPDLTATDNLIAAAGVVKLVGCEQGANANKALVRFSNVQGGVPPYEYSFDGGVSFGTVSQTWLSPGTYQLAVRDRHDCSRDNITIRVDDKIAIPTFSTNLTYNCEGKATLKINNDKGTYTYTYWVDGGALQNSNTFTNLAVGTHTILIQYADANPPTKNVLFLEDFGVGTTHVKTPYINDSYVFEPQDGSTILYNRAGVGRANPYGPTVNDGEYTVVDKMRPNLWGDDPVDHTGKTNGRMLFVNIGSSAGVAGILYQRKMMDIIPNKPIQFSIALYNLIRGDGRTTATNDPNIKLELYKTEADALAQTNVLASNNIGYIPKHANVNDWKEYKVQLNPGNNTILYAVVRSFNDLTGGNDLVIDDIYLYQDPETCPSTYTVTVVVSGDQAFGIQTNTQKITNAKCNNGTGSYQISIKNPQNLTYYVQKDNTGAFVPTTDAIYRWDNISVGTHTLKFRGDLNSTNCDFVQTFTITQPSALALNIDASKSDMYLGCNPATARVTMTATGGTPAYSYALYKGTTTITAAQASPQFTLTQAGTYTVKLTDANGCTIDKNFTISAAPTLTLTGTTVATQNNYCMSTATAGMVQVKVTAAPNVNTSPYTFFLNGTRVTNQTADAYTYTNLAVGTHTFTVIDKYGCVANYTTEIKRMIAVDGASGAVVVKDITCDAGAAGRGEITLKVKDGYAPYTYIVKDAANTIVQAAQALPANNIATYSTATAGVYTIEVTDSKGCKVSGMATLTAAVRPTVDVTTTGVVCHGANDGTISLTISGGTAPYKVKLGATGAIQNVTGNQYRFVGVSGGSHTIYVTDARNCTREETVNVAAPTAPLRGFAVVSKLVGCGDTDGNPSHKDKAQIRFTNVTGGHGQPYSYRYDGNFTASPLGWLPAGTHTVTVKDKSGCELDISVTVPKRIAPPTATTYTVTAYDCEGKGDIYISGLPNTYSYTYTIGGKTAIGTTATITGLAPGSYTMTIKYTKAASLDSNVLFVEDFGKGSKTALPAGRTTLPYGGIGGVGYYEITNATLFNTEYAGGNAGCGKQLISATCAANHVWVPAIDHTSGGADPDGRFFATNAKSVVADGELFYRREVTDVIPFSNIKWEFYVLNLFREDEEMCGTTTHAIKPNIRVQLVDSNNHRIGNHVNTGEVPNSTCGAGMANWRKYEGTLNVGNNTNFTIEFRSNGSTQHSWANDFLIDDIKVYQVPESCEQTMIKTVVVPSGLGFKASVLSQTNVDCNGRYTGKATFKLENLRGGTYNVYTGGSPKANGATSTTFEVTGLEAKTHTVTFKYTPAIVGGKTCDIDVPVTITQPAALALAATITEPAMCSNGNLAKVKLTANGGAGSYMYTYLVGGVVKAGPQTSNIFTSVAPGLASFSVKDANGCEKQLDLNTPVPAPKTVSFTISATDCYAADNQGVVTVKVTDGNGGYTMSLNGAAAVSPTTNSVTHSFTGLRQGTYTVTVRDQYGCSAVRAIDIHPSLNVKVNVTHQACAQAKIEVLTSGGSNDKGYKFYKAGTTPPANYNPINNTYSIPRFTTPTEDWVIQVKSGRCEKTYTKTIENVSLPTYTMIRTEPECHGTATGKIELSNLTGGAPFKVSVQRPGVTAAQTQVGVSGSYTITNAPAGVYTITIQDTFGCSSVHTITLADKPDLLLDGELKVDLSVNCPSVGNPTAMKLEFPQATFDAYNNNSDIYYSLDGHTWTKVTTHNFPLGAHPSFLPGATVTITYKTVSPKGGTATKCLTGVAQKTLPHRLNGLTVETNMNDFANGCTSLTQGMVATVTMSATGTSSFQYSVDNYNWEPAVPTNDRTYVWTGLTPGRTYKFYVRDSQGCTAEAEGDFYAGTATPAVQVGLTVTPACSNTTQGNVNITIKRKSNYKPGLLTGTWRLYKLTSTPGQKRTGVATAHTGAINMPANTYQQVIPTFTAAAGEIYYVEVTEGTCTWGSRDAEMKQLAPITGTVKVSPKVTCDTAGVIEVLNAQGGGGQYTYTLSVVSGGGFINPIATANNRIEILRDNVLGASNLEYPSGVQTITVKVEVVDQYGCPGDLGNYAIGVQPKPKVYSAAYTGCSNGNFAITVTPTAKTTLPAAPATNIADYRYSIDGGLTWKDGINVFTGLSAGVYPIVLQEKSTGCEGIYTVTIHDPLEASAQVSKPLGCGTTNGEITIKVDKGSGNYTYDIVPPSGAALLSGNPFTAIAGSTVSQVTHQIPSSYAPGTYTVTIRDTSVSNCSPTVIVLAVASPSYPEIEVSTYSVTCAGNNDGQLFVVEKNAPNAGTFSYTVTGPGGLVTFNMVSRSANNLVAGIYTITVTNTLTQCGKTYTATVYSPTSLTFNETLITSTDFVCSGGNTPRQAEITVPAAAINGGTGSIVIKYIAPNGAIGTGNVFSYGDPAGGVVTITITDASGCATSTVRTITAYEGLDAANVTVSSTITCLTDTITLSITQAGGAAFTPGTIYYAQGATAPTAAIGTAPWQTSGSFAVTPNDVHKFWIGNKKTGCIISYDYVSPNPNTFSIAKVAIKNVSCKGDSDGAVTLTLEDVVNTHNYNISVSPSAGVTITPATLTGGANVVNFSGLAPNTYTVTITDQNTLCKQTQVFTIAEPTVALTATTGVRSITCANNDGEIRIENVNGGWGGYQYYIDTVAPTPTSGAWTSTSVRSGLVSATYHIAVRDNKGKGCQITLGTIALTNPTTISGTLTVTQENCAAGTGKISVQTVTGGDGVNYNYQLIKDGVKEGIAQSTRTFTGLGAGSYEVVVSDAWGCSATLTAVNLYEPINNVQVHIAKEVTCASPREATLSVTHQGGSAAANLRYTITPLGGGTTTPSVIPVFTNIPAGSYVVGVKDILTACATVTYNIEVTPAVPVAFTYTQTAVGCHGGNDGTIIVTIPGTQTQTDYTIQIEGAGGFATRTETVNTTPKDFTLGGLAAGVYTVTVHSSRACQSVQTITISEPNQLVVSSTTVTTHFSCDANNQARQAIVQAVASGGATSTYTYNFVVFDGQNTSTTGYTSSSVVSINSNGTYTQTVVVYVTDANGCTANNVNSPTVIPPLKRITAIKAQQTRPIDCQGPEAVDFTIEGGSNQGYIVRVTGGTTTPSIYTVTSGVSVVSVTFDTPGYYEVTVTDSATGCYDSVNYGIANYDNISISAAQTKPVTCAAGNDGELTLSMRGYAGNYTFRVVNEYGVEVVSSTAGRNDTSDPRTQPIGGLSAGKYYVEVTETQYPNCTKTTTLATLSGPSAALTASTTITDLIKCGSGQTGSFMVTAAGGWGNYQYRLTVGTPTPAAHSVYGNYTSTSVFEGLVPETYTVWIKDQNGCETSVTQVMSPPAPIAATVTKTDVKCFSKRGGSITINGTTGGSGNYTYELWEVGGAQIYGAQTSTTFAGLDAREYNVKIVDGWNCYLTIPVTIDEPQEIKVTASIVSPTTCLQTQATIQVTATGGLGGYQYQLGGTTTYTTSNLFTLPPGSYEFYVKDANDCLSAASNKVEVVAVPKLVLKVNKAEAFVKCSGEATARITFSATGGMGDYQYSLHQGNLTAPAMTISATQINTTDWAFSGLAIGTYFVKVKSGVDCQDNSSQIDIREADLISVTTTVTNITCKGKKDGEIVVTAIGGTGTKVYAISPRFDRVVESGVFKGLSAGEYVVRVQDANGCHTDEVITITEPDLLRVRIDQQTDEVCYGANDGTISVTITGGTQSYSTSINGGVNWYQGKTLYTGLASGTYIIKVRDANGCEIPSDPITIKGGVDLQATATVEYSCPSNSVNNAVRVTVNADVAAQTTFALDGVAQASNYFTSVTAGVHTITIRHQGGCVQTLTVNVENYAPLSKTVSVTHITCYGLTNGGIQINVTGGTGSYTYSITPQAGTFSGTNMFVNLPKGQYTIQVKDAVIGCEVSERITIEEPEVLELGTLSTMTETCYQQNDGEIKFVIQGGRAPYSYELKDPAGNVVKTATGVATGTVVTYTGVSGTYNLEYKDGSCAQTREIIIAAAPSLQAVATVSYECSTVSTTNTNPYIQITLARDNSDGLISSQTLSYSINGEPIKPFVGYVNDDTQVLRTRNIENNGVYTITIFYRPLGMTSLCSYTLSDIVSVTRYPGLEILDKTDPREINKVRVKVVGGNPRAGDTPYTIYFNNSYENGESEYMLKPTDPTSRVVNGRIFKLVVVEATDANNCTSTLTIEKEYMKSVPPDFFTPNGDGQNDGWDPDIYRSYPNLTVDIYDRYGRYIKTLRSGQVWDGRYEGKEMPSGDYWYILRTHEEGDAQEYMGHFTLYR